MVTLAASVIAHAALIALLLILPLLYFTDQLPKTPDMMTFVVSSASPPPPPPPPPPAATSQKPQPVKPDAPQTPVPQPVAAAAPVEAPAAVGHERLPAEPVRELAGIEGGIAGGVAGGIAGGVPMMAAPKATVDATGAVRQLRVVRSEPLLDKAAVDAVRQWRYAPLQLNGQPQPFILTVTVSFNM